MLRIVVALDEKNTFLLRMITVTCTHEAGRF